MPSDVCTTRGGVRLSRRYVWLSRTRCALTVYGSELLPWIEPEPAAATKRGKGKSEKTKLVQEQDEKQSTVLDHFAKSRRDDSQETPGEVFTNEDGTLSGGGPLEES